MDKKRTINSSVYSPHVKKAIDFTFQYLNEELSLKRITEYLNINKSYFCKLFKHHMGITYTKFVNELRIEKSKKLLLETDLSILDIALSLGYNNPNYFIKAFKEQLGTTPLKYRKEMEG
ncbi:AraC family transcriptional regulator [Desulfitobacterium sp. PCE1]|uniref:helix-turn-helix domain-containing protein n=1 Tax=Desulfitobacterium sp. PCE1 TaxID=146907 RepID=UPI00036B83A3|nr:helix-turn-helix transcriptional regulator [Desulfitobacterium sp. PCE1]